MDISFSFSKSTIEGVKLLNNVINEETSRKLIVNAVKQLLINGPALPARSDVYESDVKLEAKRADFGVSSILIESSKHGIETVDLKNILDHYKVAEKTSNQLIESYEKFKDELTNRLSKCGNSHNLPNLTDIDYEIQHHTYPSGDVVFKITLKSFNSEKNENSIIEEIYCNQEELNMMLTRFKDIERHLEKISKSD